MLKFRWKFPFLWKKVFNFLDLTEVSLFDEFYLHTDLYILNMAFPYDHSKGRNYFLFYKPQVQRYGHLYMRGVSKKCTERVRLSKFCAQKSGPHSRLGASNKKTLQNLVMAVGWSHTAKDFVNSPCKTSVFWFLYCVPGKRIIELFLSVCRVCLSNKFSGTLFPPSSFSSNYSAWENKNIYIV